MKTRQPGKSKISVAPLGFGTLTLGPFQRNLPVDEGAGLIVHAVKRGVNLLDTAHLYETYPYIKRALEMLDEDVKKELVIVSRSYDYTREGMESSFNKALNDMGINRMSIFMLHEMESESMLRGHAPAMEYLMGRKKSGVLDMTGISTHYISGVKAAARLSEIDCIFAILNREGLGIMDGSPAEMANALQEAHEAGKFIMIMKAVGGGHLFRNAGESLAWARDLPFADCVVVGMQSVEEIEYNCAVFENKAPSEKGCRVEEGAGGRSLLIEDYCQGCGACRDACPFHAITIVDGMAKHDKNACMLCSYCARHCPLFCIKVV